MRRCQGPPRSTRPSKRSSGASRERPPSCGSGCRCWRRWRDGSARSRWLASGSVWRRWRRRARSWRRLGRASTTRWFPSPTRSARSSKRSSVAWPWRPPLLCSGWKFWRRSAASARLRRQYTAKTLRKHLAQRRRGWRSRWRRRRPQTWLVSRVCPRQPKTRTWQCCAGALRFSPWSRASRSLEQRSTRRLWTVCRLKSACWKLASRQTTASSPRSRPLCLRRGWKGLWQLMTA
mmetsp:Transcript_72119/g.215182  ORF Transcript_72119/g.215182 Transcript_72119/m.215182 type:complete len:234 (+) Transcript_72119:1027-1728(+)